MYSKKGDRNRKTPKNKYPGSMFIRGAFLNSISNEITHDSGTQSVRKQSMEDVVERSELATFKEVSSSHLSGRAEDYIKFKNE
jgi:hypothetical protein